jgi:limonene-1,2-epoxide hydrolase
MADTFPQNEANNMSHKFLELLKHYDRPAMESLLHANFTLWHNYEAGELHGAAFWEHMDTHFSGSRDLHFDDVRVNTTTFGWVQQHTVHTQDGNGNSREIPACLVFHVEDDRICRIEEYLAP